MPKVNEEQQEQVNVGTEHHGVPSSGTKPSPELRAAHTPGPWKIETPADRDNEYGDPDWDESYPYGVTVRASWGAPREGPLGASLGYEICRMSGVSDHTLLDARLIAAAPELYGLAVRVAHGDCLNFVGCDLNAPPDTICEPCHARAILAKVNAPK